jgi:predicted membrane chloride channel (bestrophin family)
MSGQYKVFENNQTYDRFWTATEAVEMVIAAHRKGKKWDVRKRVGDTRGYRPLDPDEASKFVGLVIEKLTCD